MLSTRHMPLLDWDSWQISPSVTLSKRKPGWETFNSMAESFSAFNGHQCPRLEIHCEPGNS